MPRVNAIEDEEDLEEEHLRESEDFGLIAEFLRVGDTNKYWKAAHKEAKVQLPADELSEGKAVQIVTLFDTGASGNNFMSRNFVDKHRLEEFLCPMKKRVKVADGTLVTIDFYLILKISFEHGASVTTAEVRFLVMEGLSMDLVIGLPDICLHFKEVLFHMMNCPDLGETQEFQLIN